MDAVESLRLQFDMIRKNIGYAVWYRHWRTPYDGFGVSAVSVIRWRSRGDRRPGAMGGNCCSGHIEAYCDLFLGLVGETPDATIEGVRRSLARRGLEFGYGTIQCFLVRHGMTRKKKTGHASEQEPADVLDRRQDWLDRQPGLDPVRLAFIDETWSKTNMMRTHGRTPRGQCLRMGRSYGHRKTSIFVAGLTLRGMIAPFVLDVPINRRAFETNVEKVLDPALLQT